MTEATLGQEGAALLATLSAQREHVLGALEGLDEESLRRPVLPSVRPCWMPHRLGGPRSSAVDELPRRVEVPGREAAECRRGRAMSSGRAPGPDLEEAGRVLPEAGS